MILLSDPRIAAINSTDNGESLVDVREAGLLVDTRLADDAGAFALLREGVLERLVTAQTALPGGLRLLIVEGYRPPVLQRAYFEGYREQLHETYPDWSPERLHVEASKYVSPPEVAPHGTGGAVDLTLCTADGAELDMGTAVNANPEESRNGCFTGALTIPAEARHNRQVLVRALTGAGLVNYPTEWWHWSFGERYWAFADNAPATRYGPVEATIAQATAPR
jgi:zinc D-Ala-D-Ala dipeptidase